MLVDLVMQIGDYGGLKALAELAIRRPDTPALIFSAAENHGDRFMYALTAANWFRDQVHGIVPKALGPLGEARVRFRQIVAGVIDGSYDDPTVEFLRSGQAGADCTALLDSRSDLKKWRAIQRAQIQGAAAASVPVAEQTLRTWESERLRTLARLWDEVAQHTDLAGTSGRFQPGRGQTHSQLREFVFQQHTFFADPYLDERFWG